MWGKALAEASGEDGRGWWLCLLKFRSKNTLNCRRWWWDEKNFKYFIVIQLVISEWTMICPRDISNVALMEERILWLCYVLWHRWCGNSEDIVPHWLLSCHAADVCADKKIWNWVDFTARWANCRATNCWDKVTALLFIHSFTWVQTKGPFTIPAAAHLNSERCRFCLLTITMNNPSLP